MHFAAEISNPFLMVRFILKIAKKKNLWIYGINEKLFAVTFIGARMVMAPVLIIYTYEGTSILFATKIGLSSILFVSSLWGFTILYNVAVVVKEVY